MFGKLFKHEFLATWRQFGMVWGVILIVTAGMFGVAALKVPGLSITAGVFGIMGLAAISVTTPVLLCLNYWRTMYGAPGYLTQSLPVRGRVIFAAKAVYACLVLLLATAITLGLILLATSFGTSALLGQKALTWHDIVTALGTGQLWLAPVLMPLLISTELVLYLAAITLGTRGRLGSLGAGGAVIALVIAYVALEMVILVTMLVIPWGFRVTGPDAGTLTTGFMWRGMFSSTGPDIIGMGWLPFGVLFAIVATVLAVRSVEHHTCLR